MEDMLPLNGFLFCVDREYEPFYPSPDQPSCPRVLQSVKASAKLRPHSVLERELYEHPTVSGISTRDLSLFQCEVQLDNSDVISAIWQNKDNISRNTKTRINT